MVTFSGKLVSKYAITKKSIAHITNTSYSIVIRWEPLGMSSMLYNSKSILVQDFGFWKILEYLRLLKTGLMPA